MGCPKIRDQAHIHASCDTGNHAGRNAEAVKQRNGYAHLIRNAPVHFLHHGTAVVDQLLMAQQDPLWKGCGAGRKDHAGRVLRLHLAFQSLYTGQNLR